MKITFIGLCILSLLIISCVEARSRPKDEWVKRSVLVDSEDVPPIARRQIFDKFGEEMNKKRSFFYHQ
uniref:Uncharacterized protein n=1 Tax=Trichobilharzia regenti TaxID=157069 RepID=A0AA85K4D1_TRIRE|nr:unnamed protein product [Trichobilharzia regenti]